MKEVHAFSRCPDGSMLDLNSVEALDVSTCKGANRGPKTMGYRYVFGVRGDELHELIFEGRVMKEHLRLLQSFDVVLTFWGLVPNVVEVDGVRADKLVRHDIANPSTTTAAWMRALRG